VRKRLFRIVASGVLITFIGWALFFVVITLSDDGGANEHDPRTIVEIAFNTLWAVLQWPYLFLRFIPDYYGFLFCVPLSALSIAFWGCVCELVLWRIKAVNRGRSAMDIRIVGAYHRLIAFMNLNSDNAINRGWALRIARTVMFTMFWMIPMHFLVPDEGSAIVVEVACLLLCVIGALCILAHKYTTVAWAFIAILLHGACYH
jgi:hypothetical protein